LYLVFTYVFICGIDIVREVSAIFRYCTRYYLIFQWVTFFICDLSLIDCSWLLCRINLFFLFFFGIINICCYLFNFNFILFYLYSWFIYWFIHLFIIFNSIYFIYLFIRSSFIYCLCNDYTWIY